MKIYIFRNTTIEPLFSKFNVEYSGYFDITTPTGKYDWYIWFYIIPFKTQNDTLSTEIDSYFERLLLVLKNIPVDSNLLVITLRDLYSVRFESGDFSCYQSMLRFNQNAIALQKDDPRVKIINIDDFFSTYSLADLLDWKYYYIAGIQINPKLVLSFTAWMSRQLAAISLVRKKCLVLDLDNTLWGGIIGEDGISGIKLGGDYPGNAFLDFQKGLLQLSKNGIILVVCSKNNESDVSEVWEKHPDNLIKKENIAAYRINWKDKAENLKDLIRELNIGADSVVFIDDNPSERALIKHFLPEVEAPDFPSQPYLLPGFLKFIAEQYFTIYHLTEEDRIKTKQYQENSARQAFQNKFSDFNEYLKNLEINLKIEEANDVTIARAAQLTQKTNQFNLTARRYTESEIRNFISDGNRVYLMHVSDRFGDHGITGLLMLKINEVSKIAEIDNLMLSCRILGKKIEFVFIKYILNQISLSGGRELFAVYIPTPKNNQVSDFFDQMGFTVVDSNEQDGMKRYFLNTINLKFSIEPFYKINA